MSLLSQTTVDRRSQIFDALTAADCENPNHRWLAMIIASWRCGRNVLPDYLGLPPEQFFDMSRRLFSGVELPYQAASGITLDYDRMLEKEDLINLLRASTGQHNEESEWLISIVVSACLGSDHLWQDMGLWDRSELTALLTHNFPELANRNTKNMRWKKFLYKQLCESEGLFLCRAPSCEVCSDYPECFGSEE